VPALGGLRHWALRLDTIGLANLNPEISARKPPDVIRGFVTYRTSSRCPQKQARYLPFFIPPHLANTYCIPPKCLIMPLSSIVIRADETVVVGRPETRMISSI